MIRQIPWSEWSTWNPGAIMEAAATKLPWVPMEDMSFADALWSQEGMGIYVFHNRYYDPIYIGKVSARSFLERISGHLDTHLHKGGGHTGWFNTFHQRWCEYYDDADSSAKTRYLAHVGFFTLEVPVEKKDSIQSLEKMLLHHYDPVLNKKTSIGKSSKFKPLLESYDLTVAEISEGVLA